MWIGWAWVSLRFLSADYYAPYAKFICRCSCVMPWNKWKEERLREINTCFKNNSPKCLKKELQTLKCNLYPCSEFVCGTNWIGFFFFCSFGYVFFFVLLDSVQNDWKSVHNWNCTSKRNLLATAFRFVSRVLFEFDLSYGFIVHGFSVLYAKMCVFWL